MNYINERDATYCCAFCNKSHNQVLRLIAGPGGVYICNECVDLCHEILQEGQGTPTDLEKISLTRQEQGVLLSIGTLPLSVDLWFGLQECLALAKSVRQVISAPEDQQLSYTVGPLLISRDQGLPPQPQVSRIKFKFRENFPGGFFLLEPKQAGLFADTLMNLLE